MLELYFAAAGGVAASILLPIMVGIVREQFKAAQPAAKSSRWTRMLRAVWPHLKKYLILLCFSLVMALLIVAVLGKKMQGWDVAFLAGYAWDSTLQKLTHKA
jgi:predicted Na+-dependent transporter